MQKGYKYDAVVSIDLGWSPANITRTALAYWRPGKDPWWDKPEHDRPHNIPERLSQFKGERTLVLLDIPINGTEELSKKTPFRPLDRVLLSCVVPLYPSYRAGSHGRELASEIRSISNTFEVVESYPYPIHRFMWLAQDEPFCLEGGLRAVKGIEGWKKEWPPKYKRGSFAERRENFIKLIGVLGRFLPGDYSSLLPGPDIRNRDFNALGDTYDALVALRVGMEMARSSPWVLEARVEGYDGMIPLLADSNLRGLWESNARKFLATAR